MVNRGLPLSRQGFERVSRRKGIALRRPRSVKGAQMRSNRFSHQSSDVTRETKTPTSAKAADAGYRHFVFLRNGPDPSEQTITFVVDTGGKEEVIGRTRQASVAEGE